MILWLVSRRRSLSGVFCLRKNDINSFLFCVQAANFMVTYKTEPYAIFIYTLFSFRFI